MRLVCVLLLLHCLLPAPAAAQSFVYFTDGGQLRRMPVEGGSAEPIYSHMTQIAGIAADPARDSVWTAKALATISRTCSVGPTGTVDLVTTTV